MKAKTISKPKKKSALELDRELKLNKSGTEYTSPQSRRFSASKSKAMKEEKAIEKKNANSFTRGLKGFAMGANYMDAEAAEERGRREAKRNAKSKAEEKAITAKLRKQK